MQSGGLRFLAPLGVVRQSRRGHDDRPREFTGFGLAARPPAGRSPPVPQVRHAQALQTPGIRHGLLPACVGEPRVAAPCVPELAGRPPAVAGRAAVLGTLAPHVLIGTPRSLNGPRLALGLGLAVAEARELLVQARDDLLEVEAGRLGVGDVRAQAERPQKPSVILDGQAKLLEHPEARIQPLAAQEVERAVCERVAVLPQEVIGAGPEVLCKEVEQLRTAALAATDAEDLQLGGGLVTHDLRRATDAEGAEVVLLASHQHRRVVPCNAPKPSKRGHHQLDLVLSAPVQRPRLAR
mmetsp:Transcript_11681/g.36444  ORF Transcript_11681/g.36444 Transcript_11681/m.36444 type:complete len:295 (-) Transcript_11681:130-1014(-)